MSVHPTNGKDYPVMTEYLSEPNIILSHEESRGSANHRWALNATTSIKVACLQRDEPLGHINQAAYDGMRSY